MFAAMMFAAALGSADPAAVEAPPPTPAPEKVWDSPEQCGATAKTMAGMLDSDPAGALALLKKIEASCEMPPEIAGTLFLLHAELELRAGHPKAALALLSAHQPPQGAPFWAMYRWRALGADELLGDLPAFKAVRGDLLAANLVAIAADPAQKLKKIDHFETPTLAVDVFQGRMVEGRWTRLMFFVAAPKNGGPLVTVVIELDPQASDDNAAATRYLVNAYSCDGKNFIMSATGPGGAGPPDYPSTKATVTRILGQKGIFKPFGAATGSRTCGFGGVILPGLPDPIMDDE